MSRLFETASSEYLHNASDLAGAFPFSVSCMFWTTDSDGQIAMWSCQDNTSTQDQFMLTIGSSTNTSGTGQRVQCNHRSGGWHAAISSADISLSTWHHALGVWTSASLRDVWLDGGNTGQNTDAVGTFTANTTDIGRLGDSSPNWEFQGRLAEVAMWNVALGATEALILKNGVSPLMVRPQSLTHYWPIIGRTSPEVDLIGGADMTVNATPLAAEHTRIVMPQRQRLFIQTPSVAAAGEFVPTQAQRIVRHTGRFM